MPFCPIISFPQSSQDVYNKVYNKRYRSLKEPFIFEKVLYRPKNPKLYF